MHDFTVKRFGTDPSGRPIFKTVFYHQWEQHRWENLGFELQIVQGAFMSRVPGGGAKKSSGAHDLGGCVDYRIRDVTEAQAAAVVREFREHGGAAYRRGLDAKHGDMDPHLHNTLGADQPLSKMAKTLWSSYLSGGDGLAAGPGRPANAKDYELRPNPLVKTPPPEEDDMTPEQFLALLQDPQVRREFREIVWEASIESHVAAGGTRKAQGMLTSIEQQVQK